TPGAEGDPEELSRVILRLRIERLKALENEAIARAGIDPEQLRLCADIQARRKALARQHGSTRGKSAVTPRQRATSPDGSGPARRQGLHGRPSWPTRPILTEQGASHPARTAHQMFAPTACRPTRSGARWA